MARDPGSVWKPLAEAGAPDGYTKTQFIVHSTGTLGSAAANWNYFNRGDVVVESTFIVGLSPADPTLQIMDSSDNADANGSANRRGISVETVGDGTGPFTDWQIQELIRLGRWAAATHPIERRVIPSEAASGFGWHVMFGAPGPWTTVRGKVCPGSRRIQQLKETVFPAIFSGQALEDDDMPTADEIATAIWHRPIDGTVPAWLVLRGIGRNVDPAAAAAVVQEATRPHAEWAVATLQGQIAGLQSALQQVTASPAATVDLDAVFKAAQNGARSIVDNLRVVAEPEA